MINTAYRKQLNKLAQPHIGTPAGQLTSQPTVIKDTGPEKIVVDEQTMCSNIFSKFSEKKNLPNYNGK